MGDHSTMEPLERSLLGVLQHHQSPPPEQLQSLLDEVWGMPGRFRITHSLGKKFIFHFETKEERDLVLEDTPWAVDGMFLMLRSLDDETDLDLEKLKIVTTPIWMQVHGLPMECILSDLGETFGSRVGEVMKVDECRGEYYLKMYIRVQVKIDPEFPLRAGSYVKLGKSKTMWVEFKYERVFALCFLCGRIGHSVENCDLTPGVAEKIVGAGMVQAARKGASTLYSRSVMVYGSPSGPKSNKMIIYNAEDGMPPVDPEFFKYGFRFGGYSPFEKESEDLGEPPLTMYVMRRIVRGKLKFERIDYEAIKEARTS